MSETLKPCPFCGAAAEKVNKIDMAYAEDAPDSVWDIRCGTDGCYLEHGADWWLTLSAATEKWNKRA